MRYQVVKTYGHEQGLSCVFRQWRAHSHCKYLHGYAISVELTFEASTLDARNWVIDFGSLKPVKEFLGEMYDHKMLLAVDDPMWDELHHLGLHALGVADVRVVKATGCEAIACEIQTFVNGWLTSTQHANDVRLAKVAVKEHPGNAAAVIT
jgi:6-pyruvoyltetrahydropterin/6-carboxytetrahydropterin synthase